MSVLTTIRRNKKDSNSTSDSSCIRIVLEDGTTLRYTDSMFDLTTSIKNQNGVEVPITSVTYSSIMGFNLSAVGGNSNEAGVVDLEGVLGPLGYTREQIAQGLFDNARLYSFLTDQDRPVEDEEKMFSGFWGETTMIDGRYISKFTSLLSILEVDTGRLISQFCDTKLGSLRCGVKMEAGTRLGGNFVEFDPLTSLSVRPIRWIDFSDNDYLQIGGSDFTRAYDKADSGYEFRQLSSNKPTVTTLNGKQACRFLTGEYFTYTTTSGTSTRFISGASSFDIFIVSHNVDNDLKLAYLWDLSSTSPLGPCAESGSSLAYFSDASTSTNYLRTYNDELTQYSTRDQLYQSLATPSVIMSNRFTDNSSEIFGARVTGGYNTIGYTVGEILVYPQLKNTDRKKVIKYLTDKWSITVDTKPIEGQDDNDARTRRLIAVDGIDYVWFEAFGNGELGALEPTWSETLGSNTTDGDISWLAVPARKLTLTTQAGYGVTSTFLSNENLPSDFEDVYEQASFEVLTGVNKGTKGIILTNTLDTFTLNYPTLKEFNVGDEVLIQISCFKTDDYCNSRFSNMKNFQGFNSMPTNTKIYKRGKK